MKDQIALRGLDKHAFVSKPASEVLTNRVLWSWKLSNKNKQTLSHREHSTIGVSSTTAALNYVELWKHRDYFDDIPDEVPDLIMHAGLAPSYKAIAIALLKNDTRLASLGMGAFTSKWYSPLKAIELGVKKSPQFTLF